MDNKQIEQNENFQSTAIRNELKQFERMKKKNEMDLLNTVEYELQRKIMQKEAELKIKKQNLKLENFKKEVEAKHKIENLKQEQREMLKRQKLEEEEEQRKKAD